MDAKQYRIETMADFLALSQEERLRLIPDLLEWARVVDEIKGDAELNTLVTPAMNFVWVDDGNPARVKGFVIGDKEMFFDEDDQ